MVGNFFRISGVEGNREIITMAASAAIKALKDKGYTIDVSDESIALVPGRNVRGLTSGRRGTQVIQRASEPTDPLILTIQFRRAPVAVKLDKENK